jgi:hypothetical protein
MSLHTRVVTFACIVAAPLAITGCAASPEEAEAARLQVDTPLPHDPTDRFELGPWWSDGKHLLNLRADGGYSIYKDNNRYTRPIDRGRWGQQNYGTMWLMPYGGADPQRVRVAIMRIDGRLALQPPKYGTMFAIASPPRVGEDDLIGRWQGPVGTLTLNSDATYQFMPASGALDADGKVLAGHNGRWNLSSGQVILAPTTQSVKPMSLKVNAAAPQPVGATSAAAAEPVLEGFGGQLVKVKAGSA